MSKYSSIAHVDLVVNSYDKSLPFYEKLFELLGWYKESEIKGERGEPLVYYAGTGGELDAAVGIRERQSHKTKKPYDRYDLGIHHLALNTESNKTVDKIAHWLRIEGYKIESGPKLYRYSKNYYAIFFFDPDGIKLEVVAREDNP